MDNQNQPQNQEIQNQQNLQQNPQQVQAQQQYSQQQYSQQQYSQQAGYGQPQYQQPVYQQVYQTPMGDMPEPPVTVGNWMLTIFLSAIPCVNIIMLFVWAFGSSPKSKSNWAKATLIWTAIGIGVSIILSIIFTVLGVNILQNISYSYRW